MTRVIISEISCQSGAGELQKLSSSNGHGVIPGGHRDLAECIGANGRAPLASEPLRSDKEVLSPPINQKESRPVEATGPCLSALPPRATFTNQDVIRRFVPGSDIRSAANSTAIRSPRRRPTRTHPGW